MNKLLSMKAKLFFLLIAIAMTASAQKRSDADMKAIALQKLNGIQVKGRDSQTIDIKSLYEAEQLSIYGNDNGFVVVSREATTPPVLGYSDKAYDADNMPDGFKWWLRNTNQGLSSRRAMPEGWTRKFTPVSPLMTTEWGQSYPYNMLCPKIKADGTDVLPSSGCVATALAQILKYYKYPQQGRGKGNYYASQNLDDVVNPVTVTISGKYNYGSMLDNYSKDEGNMANQRSVATLVRDCGYASSMSYSLEGSGSSIVLAARGSVYNFAYDSLALHNYEREFFTENEWRHMIYDELEASNPILYGAHDYIEGGHAFVFDGLDEEGLVHVNWGWNGWADGFYDMFNLKPSIHGGPDDDFELSHMMVLGFRPHETPTDDEGYETFFTSTEKYTYEVDGENLILNLKDANNYGFLDVKMFLALCFFNVDDDESFDGIRLSNSTVMPSGYGYYNIPPLKINLNDSEEDLNLQPGTYDVIIAAIQDSDRGLICPIRSAGTGALIYQITKSADGTLTLSDDVTNFETGINQVFFKDAKNGFVPNIEKGKPVGSDLYDMTGRKISEPVSGQIYIERYRYSDGSTYSVKRIAK